MDCLIDVYDTIVCKALGLVEGSCCPTTPTHLKANGVMLDCCGASEGSPISDEWMALLHAVHAGWFVVLVN